MRTDDTVKDKKLQYNINREAAKASSAYCQIKLINMDILQSDQSRITKQEKLTYSLIGKAFEKQVKMIEEQGKKQVDVIANQK